MALSKIGLVIVFVTRSLLEQGKQNEIIPGICLRFGFRSFSPGSGP